ncbi:cytidine deaminase-like protein [Flagelloscypha sp. PMI_526]|nr:cytidine deaminase-like protein [Flagelloscypha sp. PMI_526]
MFISVVGTQGSGKSTIVNHLVASGFVLIHLDPQPESTDDAVTPTFPRHFRTPSTTSNKHLSFLSMNFSPANSPITSQIPLHAKHTDRLAFDNPTSMLDFVTQNWRGNYITEDLTTRAEIETFTKRPFFMLIRVDAPALSVPLTYVSIRKSLEDFLREDDEFRFNAESSLDNLRDLVHIDVTNNFEDLQSLRTYIDDLHLLDPRHLRPSWDQYFMTLASLASKRSNCMKRRVGAILVRENRIVATGYNGTPRGVTNCNEGGCARCNGTPTVHECVCLHAEENALLEAGRERVGPGCVLYCNTCPCLKCTIKIIQTGVNEVVYNLSYKVDEASASLMQEAGVKLRHYEPSPIPNRKKLLPKPSKQDLWDSFSFDVDGKSSVDESPTPSIIASASSIDDKEEESRPVPEPF